MHRDPRLQTDSDELNEVGELHEVAMSLDTADGKSAVDQRHRLEFSRLSTEETMKACTCALSLVMLISACGRPDAAFPRGELVDLSHTYDAQTIYWPTAEGFRLQGR